MLHVLTDEEYKSLLEATLRTTVEPPFFCVTDPLPLSEVVSRYVETVVRHCKGSHTQSAAVLGVHRHTVTHHLKAKTTSPNLS